MICIASQGVWSISKREEKGSKEVHAASDIMARIRLTAILLAITFSSLLLAFSVFSACRKMAKLYDFLSVDGYDGVDFSHSLAALLDKIEQMEARLTELQQAEAHLHPR